MGHELPFVVGLVVAFAWVRGPLLHPLGHPAGSDFGQYLSSAAAVWGDSADAEFIDWRKPWFPYLLGLLGHRWGYYAVGSVIARASLAVGLVAAGGVGRALGGPWAGALAALVAARWGPLYASATWITSYPLFAACAGVAWLGAAACARRPHPAWALLAGAGGAAALAVDDRGLTVLLPAAGVAVVASLAASGWARRIGGVVAVLATVGIGQLAEQRLEAMTPVTTRALGDSIREQRAISVEGDRLANRPPDAVSIACAATPARGATVLDLATDPCGEALRARNLAARRRHGELPPEGFPWLLVPALLPGRWGRGGGVRAWIAGLRGTVAAVGIFGGSIGAVWLAAGLAELPDRYLLAYAAPLAALLPVAALRVAAIGRGIPWVGRLVPLVGAGVAAWAAATTWPRLDRPLRPTDLPAADGHDYAALLAWSRATLGPDALLYDCSGLYLYLADLPRDPLHYGCPSHVSDGPSQVHWPELRDGPSWLVVRMPPQATGWRDAVSAAGWVEVERPPGTSTQTSLWRLPPGVGVPLDQMPAHLPAAHAARRAAGGAPTSSSPPSRPSPSRPSPSRPSPSQPAADRPGAPGSAPGGPSSGR